MTDAIADLMESRLPNFLKSVRFSLVENHAINAKGLTWLENKTNSNQISPYLLPAEGTVQYTPKHPSCCSWSGSGSQVPDEVSPLLFSLLPAKVLPPGEFEIEKLPCLFITVQKLEKEQVTLDFLVLGSSLYDATSMGETLLALLTAKKHRHSIRGKLKAEVATISSVLESGNFRNDLCYSRLAVSLSLMGREVIPQPELPLLFFGKRKLLVLGKNIKLTSLKLIAGGIYQVAPSYEIGSEPISLQLNAYLERLSFEQLPLIVGGQIRIAPRLLAQSQSPGLVEAYINSITSTSPLIEIDPRVSGRIGEVPTRQLTPRRTINIQFSLQRGGIITGLPVTELAARRRIYLPNPYAVWQIVPIPAVDVVNQPANENNNFALSNGRQITANGEVLTVFTVKSNWGHLRFQVVSVSLVEYPYAQRFNYQTSKFSPDYFQIILPGVVEDNLYLATIYEMKNN